MPTTSLDVLARIEPTVRPSLIALAEGFTGPPAQPRRAASVVLLRESDGLETYLLHRHARMAFAASMVAFPGGGLDPLDESAPDPVRACAVRETREETGVDLNAELLLAWAHWITPAPEPRRYDTYFFLAALPDGQEAQDISGETDRARWTRPVDALSANAAGSIALMPPTLSILTELADASGLAEVLARASDRLVITVEPELVRQDGGWTYRYPSAP